MADIHNCADCGKQADGDSAEGYYQSSRVTGSVIRCAECWRVYDRRERAKEHRRLQKIADADFKMRVEAFYARIAS